MKSGNPGRVFKNACVKLRRKLLPRFFSEKVWPANISDEEEISRENKPRSLCASTAIKERPRNVLWRVAWSVECSQKNCSKLDFVPVRDDAVGVGWCPRLSTHARGVNSYVVTQPVLELCRATDEIRMDMRFENVADSENLRVGRAQGIRRRRGLGRRQPPPWFVRPRRSRNRSRDQGRIVAERT